MFPAIASLYPWILTGHVISFVAWMAGLFYLPRLFVYHVERATKSAEMTALFETMESRLLRAIMNPAMIATWAFGLTLLSIPGTVDWSMAWPWTKACAVLGMTAFHMWCAGERRRLADGQATRAGRFYRIANEVPTLLLIIIVISVIARPF